MATIIRLPAQRQGRPASAVQESGAQILFFTGVRYERESDVAPAMAVQPPAAAVPEATRDVRTAV